MTRTEQQVKYQAEQIMPLAKKQGCKCEFSHEKYAQHAWSHAKDCPAPIYENLPNPGRLIEALRRSR